MCLAGAGTNLYSGYDTEQLFVADAQRPHLFQQFSVVYIVEKSLDVNVHEFLGFRIKAVKRVNGHKTKYVVRSHIKNKSLEKISEDVKRLIHKIEFPGPGKRSEHAAVTRYNSYENPEILNTTFSNLQFLIFLGLCPTPAALSAILPLHNTAFWRLDNF